MLFFVYFASIAENAFIFTHTLDSTQTSWINVMTYCATANLAVAGMTNGHLLILDMNSLIDANVEQRLAVDKFIVAETFMNTQICSVCIHPVDKLVTFSNTFLTTAKILQALLFFLGALIFLWIFLGSG